ncbi:hypothetical protein [Haladaptatus sp. ZSTT2]|uniref:hypothetical protein n=1 Tax=Haladaptatus sp. ZSTT2 TaxID=3120515 RepID=UPI00300F0578
MASDRPASVAKADHYRLPDGTVEIVFAVEGGRVLTFREYQSPAEFSTAVEDGEYLGSHAGVADLPNVEAFRNDL